MKKKHFNPNKSSFLICYNSKSNIVDLGNGFFTYAWIRNLTGREWKLFFTDAVSPAKALNNFLFRMESLRKEPCEHARSIFFPVFKKRAKEIKSSENRPIKIFDKAQFIILFQDNAGPLLYNPSKDEWVPIVRERMKFSSSIEVVTHGQLTSYVKERDDTYTKALAEMEKVDSSGVEQDGQFVLRF